MPQKKVTAVGAQLLVKYQLGIKRLPSLDSLTHLTTMYSSSKTFKYVTTDGHRSTVVQTDDDTFLEVRRDDITWTKAFRAAHPFLKQHAFASIDEWHGILPSEPTVSAWRLGKAPPKPVFENNCWHTSYWLSLPLSRLMGAAAATGTEVFQAITDYSEKFPTSPFLNFLLGEDWTSNLSTGNALIMWMALDKNGHFPDSPMVGLSIQAWQDENPVEAFSSTELRFSPELTAFLRQPMGGWTDVNHAFQSYTKAYAHWTSWYGTDGNGYILADASIRCLFGLNDGGKGFMTFSDFRKQMLARGHICATAGAGESENPALLIVELDVATDERTVIAEEDSDSDSDSDSIESEDSDDSDYVPSDEDSESDTDSMPALEPFEPMKRVVTGCQLVEDVLEFSRRWKAAHPAPAPAEKPLLRCVPPLPLSAKGQTPSFKEINDTWFRVQAEIESLENGHIYKQQLAVQFIQMCLRPSLADAWRSHSFERLQMRASLAAWLEIEELAASKRVCDTIQQFLSVYPA